MNNKQQKAGKPQTRLPGGLVFWAFFASGLFASGLFAQETSITGRIEWASLEIDADVSLNLASAGLKLPGGRVRAEEMVIAAYPSLIQPRLLSLPVDSYRSISDLIDEGEFSYYETGGIAANARRIPPAMSEDLTHLKARYVIDLGRLGSALNRHGNPSEIINPVYAGSSPDYTGIIIMANVELPVHGIKSGSLLLPCLFPKIWDTGMNLIYERNMVKSNAKTPVARYAGEADIFRPTPSGLSGDLAALVGEKPLRIIAREAFGKRPTDPVIDREDALLILANENNRRLLREGRVVIVLADSVLREEF